MTVYMSRLFPKSNSSIILNSGKALKSHVTRFRDDLFLVNAGLGAPKLTTPDELNRIPPAHVTRFETTVGFIQPTSNDSFVKTQMLERMFVDLVAGEPDAKERAVARFNDLIGPSDAVAGEPAVMLPRRFMQNQAWVEMNKMWKSNRKVRGFLLEKVRGGYSVAVAGYIAFFPFRSAIGRRSLAGDMFTVESINNRKRKKITVV